MTFVVRWLVRRNRLALLLSTSRYVPGFFEFVPEWVATRFAVAPPVLTLKKTLTAILAP